MIINNSKNKMLDAIIRINNDIYLPISDMGIIYNIKVNYNENTNRVIIDELDKGMIKASITKETNIKFRPRGLSKNIGFLKQGEIVYCFYTTRKGWTEIRTSDGIIGYVKANKLGNEYIIRQDMKKKDETIKISKNDYNNKFFEIYQDEEIKKITLKSKFNITNNNMEIVNSVQNAVTNNKIWVSISNESLGSEINKILKDYKFRTNLIDLILTKSIENNVKGISIEFTKIEDKETMRRFIIELAPKLREVGITTCVVLNENINEEDYINIVDYIVE